MFTTKCQVQKDCATWKNIQCACKHLLIKLYFDTKDSIFKLPASSRVPGLITSFYKRYASCLHNKSNRSNKLSAFRKFNTPNTLVPSYIYKLQVFACCMLYFFIHPYSKMGKYVEHVSRAKMDADPLNKAVLLDVGNSNSSNNYIDLEKWSNSSTMGKC